MSMNPGADDAPLNFMEALYGVGDEDEDHLIEDEDSVDEREFLFDDDELDPVERDSSTPPPPPYSAHPSPETEVARDRGRSRSSLHESGPSWLETGEDRPRSRSRSPLHESGPRGILLAIYDEDGSLLYSRDTSDPHALNESAEQLFVERGDGRGRSLRGRGRGRRGGRVGNRGQGRGRGGHRRRQHGWQVGQPLEEVWLTDDDVPFELREMVMDVVRRRQTRVNAMEARRRERASEEASEMNVEHDSGREDEEVFYDAIDGRGNSVLEGVDLHFEWSPMGTFRGVEETFIPEHTGSVSSYTNPYDAFRSFWDDNILQVIVDETNRYASRIRSATFQAGWHPINLHELLCLFAFWMMTGIIRMPTIVSYFSTNPLLKTEVFSQITTLRRYTHLNRALNFADTSDTDPSANPTPTNNDAASSDPLHRLRPIIDHLNSKFQANYVLSKDVCIDESLTLWKGKLKFKQYIRSKAVKYGIKTFELCESATGYLWSFLVYTGKQTSVDLGIAKSSEIVLKLVRPILNKGYRLFMDNWFNSPLLARILKRNGTDCVGTLRASRVDVPQLVTRAPLRQGQLVARHSGDVCVLSWLDKKRINMISTCHGSATGLPHVTSRPPARPEPFKPQSVLDYNRAMGGVDLKDQMLEPYMIERKRCAKWHLKLFKRLLNCSIHNSRVLLESSLQARQDNLKFRLELVHAILSHHHSKIPGDRRAQSHSSVAPPISTHRIVNHTHWPIRVPPRSSDSARNRNSRQRCVVCLREGRKQSKTHYICETCKVPLCVEGCFKKYHTSSQ